MSDHDAYYMMLAINEAKKGLYTTRPNPAVGSVIVNNDTIVGTGFHPKAGQPHAEVYALRQAKDEAKGATAYVTLEPCSHQGRTPPCANALIHAGVTRVVIAGLDPNPQVAGRGVHLLKQAGIDVKVGVAADKAEALNKGFLKAMRHQMPYVRLKLASSLDGRTAMASGESKWISGSQAREDVQKIRAMSGAIITGSQTIIDDNPRLNVRSKHLITNNSTDVPQPKVIVLDRRGRLQGRQQDFTALSYSNSKLISEVDLKKILHSLVVEDSVHDVLVEAGASVAGSFIASGLVDEIIIYQAPCFLGSQAKPLLNIALDKISEQYRYSIESIEQLSEDVKLVLLPLSPLQ